jgi:hypothetical protein
MIYRRGPRTAGRLRPSLRVSVREEPALEFAGQRQHVDQKTGLSVFGPASLGMKRHPATIRIGFIGSSETLESATGWFEKAAVGVPGDRDAGLLDFPGFMPDRGFFSEINVDTTLTQTITQHEIREITSAPLRRDRFEAAVNLIDDRVRLLSTGDNKPNVVVLAVPNEILEHARTIKFTDPNLGLVYRDFRRALKARIMRHQLPIQLMLQRTSEATEDDDLDHPSRIAWNLFTSLYYKGGGIPWRAVGLEKDTCYIGVSFFRPLATESGTLHVSAAQAFDRDGVGLILRGPDFHWDEAEGGPSAHLDADKAKQLLDLVLDRFRDERQGQLPSRVVVHKTSRFLPAEREGFQDALREIPRFDLVAVSPTSEIRLLREGRFPPLRGTFFELGEVRFLYTTGYIPALRRYPHGHVPTALQIADHHGDTPLPEIADEILVLTKMNWNSAGFSGTMPITVRFSRRVGEIMRELRADDPDPMPQFMYYT